VAPEEQPTAAVPAQPPPSPAPQQRQASAPPPVRGQRAPAGRPRRRRFGVEQARNPEFTLVFRGYEREAVDRYVAQVIELITELEATQTREGTVQRALEEVGEQTSSILQRAHETAEEIVGRARAQAEGRLARADRDAEQTVADAEADAQRLRSDARRVWEQRMRMIEELRRLSDEVLGVADDALERLDPPDDGEPEDTTVEAEASPSTPHEDGSASAPPQRRTVGPIGDPLDMPPKGAEPTGDEEPAVRRVGPERRQG
jgi:DivIVA domain-containing protein